MNYELLNTFICFVNVIAVLGITVGVLTAGKC